ncbi:hypothetical protein [Eubacterium limosum]|uniref:hypothetical protein n=1 Tax=Eubacterium limosum TaxID=1736 RepID=UPI00371B8FA5
MKIVKNIERFVEFIKKHTFGLTIGLLSSIILLTIWLQSSGVFRYIILNIVDGKIQQLQELEKENQVNEIPLKSGYEIINSRKNE